MRQLFTAVLCTNDKTLYFILKILVNLFEFVCGDILQLFEIFD